MPDQKKMANLAWKELLKEKGKLNAEYVRENFNDLRWSMANW